ncbi:MAG: PrgI family protein [bacterium]
MQFVVPQFIDVEDKIIGPISTRQFIIMLAGGLLMFVEYKSTDFSLFIAEGLITLAVVLVLGFIKVNGQPFHYFLLNLIQTFKRPKLKLWDKELAEKELRFLYKAEIKEKKPAEAPVPLKRPASNSRLSELSLIVDTGGAYQGEK